MIAARPKQAVPERLRPLRPLVACVTALVAALLLAAAPPARVAIQTVLLLPSVVQTIPVDPLAWWTSEPTVSEHRIQYSAGEVIADVYHPGRSGGFGGVVLQFGAVLARRDPVLVRFAHGLARSGLVVVVPESSNLLVGRIVPEERDAMARTYDLLLQQPGVDPGRTAFLGFSVGGAMSLLAASEPGLGDRLRLVNTFGGYFDARQLLIDISSRSIEVDGQERPWEPGPLTEQVFRQQLLDLIQDPEERARVEALSLGTVAPDPGPDGKDVLALLLGTTRADAKQRLARLPESAQQRLTQVSPSASIDQLRTKTYVMHDTGDTFIPFTESRDLVAAAKPGVVQRYVEFSIFEHVYPDRPVPWQTFLPELWSLFWYVHAVLLELL